jgi:hypothetical protein
MAIVERHRSADGLLELIVDHTAGDWTIGFSGVPGHTHGDILAELEGGSPESATKAYVRDILDSKRVIVIHRVDGVIRDAWVADVPVADLVKPTSPTETIETRLWNGQPAAE